MTRAIVYLIGADGSTLKLFCNHDSYICNGLGEALYRFCMQQGQGASPEKVLYALLTAKDPYLDLDCNGDEVVDYVYKIICSPLERPQLKCWEVDWQGDNKRPLADRMGDPLDIEAEINNKDKNEWPGLFQCPFCGTHPSIVSSFREGTTICCDNSACPGRFLIGRYQVAHDAEIAWNDVCKRINANLDFHAK